MRATDIILKKRGTGGKKGEELTRDEIHFMVSGYTDGSIPDYQMSAFMMAVYFSGMSFKETGFLTEEMLHSGDVINLHGKEAKGLKGPFVDKHSTGGVGDKISIHLAPLVASLGIQVPMMSGRGLGHTGGTLDKLESLPGYNVNLSTEEFERLIAKNNYAMTGQTLKIVPADKKMYALRDVTGTVESIPLITSSILSKKVAEGSDCLMFDVKYGSGAFMKSLEDAEKLAVFLVQTAKSMNKKASALLTSMESPLGNMVGNYLEVEESILCLQGKGCEDLMNLTYALGSRMAVMGGKAKNIEEGEKLCRASLESGKALECFLTNVRDQGADPEKLMAEIGKRRSDHHREIFAKKDGYLKIDAYRTGLAGITLGVGRSKTSDPVDPDSGIIFSKHDGDFVHCGEKIMDVYGKDEDAVEKGKNELEGILEYSEREREKSKLIFKEIN